MFFDYSLFAGWPGTLLLIVIIIACFWRKLLKWVLIFSPVILYIIIGISVDACKAHREEVRLRQHAEEDVEKVMEEGRMINDSLLRIPIYRFADGLLREHGLTVLASSVSVTDTLGNRVLLKGSAQNLSAPAKGGRFRIVAAPLCEGFRWETLLIDYLDPMTGQIVTIDRTNS